MSWNDPIVEEVRKVRDNIAADHNYAIEAIGRYYQEKQKQARCKPVDRMNQRPDL